MKTKMLGIAGAVAGFIATAQSAFASSFFTIPTSTVTDLQANVSDTIADPGVLALLVLAIGVPLVFYLLHRAKRVAPGGGR